MTARSLSTTCQSGFTQPARCGLRAYAEGGAPWYWIADPEAAAPTVYRNDGSHFHRLTAGDADHPLDLTEPFPITLDSAAVSA